MVWSITDWKQEQMWRVMGQFQQLQFDVAVCKTICGIAESWSRDSNNNTKDVALSENHSNQTL